MVELDNCTGVCFADNQVYFWMFKQNGKFVWLLKLRLCIWVWMAKIDQNNTNPSEY